MTRRLNIALSALAGFSLLMTGCDKYKAYETIVAPGEAHFTGAGNQSYSIVTAAPPAYTITVGTTDVSNVDRTIPFTVSSRTGATSGTHYTLDATSGTVTIPAGKATAEIKVQGIFNPYNGTGRKDTLMFTLPSSSVAVSSFQDTVYLAMRGPCFDGDVTLTEMLGNYRAVETFGTGAPYGPYATSVSSVTSTSATTGTMVITNIWNAGWAPITFVADWTNPTAITLNVVTTTVIGGSDAGDLNSGYAGQTMQARPFAGNPGTFSICNQTLTLRMQLGVSNVGYFGSLYTVNMTR